MPKTEQQGISHPRSPRWSGHAWTAGVRVLRALRRFPGVESTPWEAHLEDPMTGHVRLTGRLSGAGEAGPGRPRLVVLVHGLGGSAESLYALEAAAAAHVAGFDCLRVNLRGADLQGEDFYHAGLTEDLHATLTDSSLDRYREVHLLGYSLGGHVALRWATQEGDARVRSVAAICSPLDLDGACRSIDGPWRKVYRDYVLGRLKSIYRAVAARRDVPTPVERTDRVRFIREWDELTVAPRFGFADAADYYARMSAGPVLASLRVPALLVATQHDPMVEASTLLPYLDPLPPDLEVRWVGRGGHVAFPRGLDLGFAETRGLLPQVLAWSASQGA